MNYYKKEVEENEAKLASMKDENRDPYDIKKFEEVLGESYMMVPDSEGRLNKSLEDLAQFLTSDVFTSSRKGNDDGGSEWETTAREMLAEHFSSEQAKKPTETQTDSTASDVKETDVTDLKDDEAF